MEFFLASCALFIAYLLAYVSSPLKQKLFQPLVSQKEIRKARKMLQNSIFSACFGLFCAVGGTLLEALKLEKELKFIVIIFYMATGLCLFISFSNLAMLVWLYHKRSIE